MLDWKGTFGVFSLLEGPEQEIQQMLLTKGVEFCL